MSRTIITAALAASAAGIAGGIPAGAQDDAARTGGSFLEEFDGDRLDRTLWFVSDGWVNGDWHGCSWNGRNVEMRGGELALILDDTETDDRPYSCGEIQTTDVYHHGAYEVRMSGAAAPGIISAFFTYTGPHFGDPHDEIDIEFPGARPRTVELNNWVDGEDADDDGVKQDLGFDASADLHDYAFVWAPDSLRWYVDGELVREITDPARIPQTPSKIFASIFNGTEPMQDWLGRFDYPGEPLVARIARIAYTAPGEPCQFEGSIACEAPR
ncbi:family 16 glycosylhydrolase [Salinarimonas sp.]|uniref:family 16 glycosylhydrolase n=1 Tax=Salinarimonas sp. TaxID=2766526 RepID=UPI0032D9574F